MKSSLFLATLSICLLAHSAGCQNAKAPAAERASEPEPIATKESEGFRPGALGMEPPLLTKHEQLDKHIGQLVAIRGTVSNSKIATIIGVDVEPGELRGEDCYAVGILTKWTTTQEQLDELLERHGPVATRGPGTTYKLYFDLSGKGSQARKWPSESDDSAQRVVSANMVFTLGPSAHLGSLATGLGIGTIFRSTGIVRFVWGGVVKTFR